MKRKGLFPKKKPLLVGVKPLIHQSELRTKVVPFKVPFTL